MISWWRTSLHQEEIDSVALSIKNEHLSLGPVTAELENRFAESLGIPYAVATTSGSMALLMAVMAAGIKPGDEVIVPNRTWIATAHAVYLAGAKVVLADVLPDLPVIDPAEIKKKITKRTKAIIPVHLCGRSDNMNLVNQIAKEHGLMVIEDAAQALYSKNREGYLGTQSLMGCFSFSVSKLVTAGQGGMVVTKSKELYEKLKLIRTHGVKDVINVSYTQPGFNFRYTDILASIMIAQLKRVPQRLEHLHNVYNKYEKELKRFASIKLIPVNTAKGEVPLYIEALCEDRDKLVNYLSNNEVQTRPFYGNVNRAEYFGNKVNFPYSNIYESKGLYLPCGVEQPLGNIDRVISLLRAYK